MSYDAGRTFGLNLVTKILLPWLEADVQILKMRRKEKSWIWTQALSSGNEPVKIYKGLSTGRTPHPLR